MLQCLCKAAALCNISALNRQAHRLLLKEHDIYFHACAPSSSHIFLSECCLTQVNFITLTFHHSSCHESYVESRSDGSGCNPQVVRVKHFVHSAVIWTSCPTFCSTDAQYLLLPLKWSLNQSQSGEPEWKDAVCDHMCPLEVVLQLPAPKNGSKHRYWAGKSSECCTVCAL